MRVLGISDLHCTPLSTPPVEGLPRADLVVVAGDLTRRGEPEEVRAWVRWVEGALAVTGARDLLWIRGNHDVWQSGAAVALEPIYRLPGVREIPEQEVIRVQGLRVWASSASAWNPEPYYVPASRLATWHAWTWAEGRREVWAGIPDGLDLLVTHVPPSGVLDLTEEGVSSGDPELSKALGALRIPPRVHVFGHIHEGAEILPAPGRQHEGRPGWERTPWGTLALNVAARDRRGEARLAQGALFEL